MGISETEVPDPKRLYRRLILSWWDFYRAGEFAELLAESWNNNDHVDKTRQVAFTVAAVVSYARPFSGNRDTGDTRGTFPDELREEALNDRDCNLHEHLMESRHREFAHSDSDVHDLSIEIKGFRGEKVAVPLSRDPMIPLGPDVTEHLRTVIKKLIRATEIRKRQLEDQFDIGEEI